MSSDQQQLFLCLFYAGECALQVSTTAPDVPRPACRTRPRGRESIRRGSDLYTYCFKDSRLRQTLMFTMRRESQHTLSAMAFPSSPLSRQTNPSDRSASALISSSRSTNPSLPPNPYRPWRAPRLPVRCEMSSCVLREVLPAREVVPVNRARHRNNDVPTGKGSMLGLYGLYWHLLKTTRIA